MKTRLYQFGFLLLAVAIVLVLPNCNVTGATVVGKVTGGGWIETKGGGKANFGFNGSNCDDPAVASGRFNYHDPGAGFPGGLKMEGSVLAAKQCTSGIGCTDADNVIPGTCPFGGYLVSVGYRSTNPKVPGTGTAGACVVDNGEGKNGTGDLLGLGVSTGPYSGYAATGTVHGNIQGHKCN